MNYSIEDSHLKRIGDQKSASVWSVFSLSLPHVSYIKILQSKTLTLGPDAGKTFHRIMPINRNHAESIIEDEGYIE